MKTSKGVANLILRQNCFCTTTYYFLLLINCKESKTLKAKHKTCIEEYNYDNF